MNEEAPATPPTMQPTSSPAPRPTTITVICVLGFIGGLITVPLIFSDIARRIGDWYRSIRMFGGSALAPKHKNA